MENFSKKIYIYDRPGFGREGIVPISIKSFVFDEQVYTTRAIGIYVADGWFRAYYWFANDSHRLGAGGTFTPDGLEDYLREIVPLPKYVDKTIYDAIWALLPQPIAEEFPPQDPFNAVCGGPDTIKITRMGCYIALELLCDYDIHGIHHTKRIICVWAHGAVDVIRLTTFEGPRGAPPLIFRGKNIPLEYVGLCGFILAHPDWFHM